jgi:hypothetical protein
MFEQFFFAYRTVHGSTTGNVRQIPDEINTHYENNNLTMNGRGSLISYEPISCVC